MTFFYGMFQTDSNICTNKKKMMSLTKTYDFSQKPTCARVSMKNVGLLITEKEQA